MPGLRAVARLIPAGLGVTVTAALAWTMGSSSYGEYSALLAKGSMVNAACFHWSRHMVTFAPLYRFDVRAMHLAWRASLTASTFFVIAMVGLSLVSITAAALVLGYSWTQASLERAFEYLRSHHRTLRYVMAACARPAATLCVIAAMTATMHVPSPLMALGLVTITACIARTVAAAPGLYIQPQDRIMDTRALMRATAPLVPTLGYLFISDGIVRIMLARTMASDVFGRLSTWADLSMPAIWVIVSAATWSMIPTALAMAPMARQHWLHRRVRAAVVVAAAAVITACVAPPIFRTELALMASQMLASLLACVVFPSLVIAGKPISAAAIAMASLVAIIALGHIWPGDTPPFLTVNAAAVTAAFVVVRGTHRDITGNTK